MLNALILSVISTIIYSSYNAVADMMSPDVTWGYYYSDILVVHIH